MPRVAGSKNYRNDVLIPVVKELLPNGELGWQAVATMYHARSREANVRDSSDVKRHWMKNLCNGMKKPTGRTGGANDRVHKCIAIEKLILDKTQSQILGVSSDEENTIIDGTQLPSLPLWGAEGGYDDDDEEEVVEEEGLNYNGGDPFLDDIDGGNNEGGNNDEDAELSAINRGNAKAGSEMVTPRSSSTTSNISTAARRAAVSVANQKSKNSLNKNKDRTSNAGTIAKLLDGMNGGHSDNSNMTTMMNMMMMRQMERMEKEEHRREKRAKKRRRAKKAKQAAYAETQDHGGKKDDGDSSSDSDSSSSSD